MKKYLYFLIVLLFACNSEPSAIRADAPGYATDELKGATLADLYAAYLGSNKKLTVGETLHVDFDKALRNMWHIKIKRAKNTVVDSAGLKLCSEYKNNKTLLSLDTYANHISDVVADLRNEINWKSIQSYFAFSDADIALVKKITKQFQGKDMIAYILTELMPSSDGNLNCAMLDFLLRNAGREYVESIPAMYDSKTSFGPYQFTEYALYCTPKETRCASIINMALPLDHQIPGSVCLLRGDDHHRAAYLFVIYNMCYLIQSLNEKEKATLRGIWKNNPTNLFLYCATAHHIPVLARKAAKLWLDNKGNLPFELSCKRSIYYYAIKTKHNLVAERNL